MLLWVKVMLVGLGLGVLQLLTTMSWCMNLGLKSCRLVASHLKHYSAFSRGLKVVFGVINNESIYEN